jgi:hypothetical protein
MTAFAQMGRLGRLIAWTGVGLGAVELLAPRSVAKALGIASGHETLVRAFGAREIATSVLLLTGAEEAGLWSRLAGDGLNLGLLAAALRRDNPKCWRAALGLAVLTGLLLRDLHDARHAMAHPSAGTAEE